jgi:hypothetical protein
MSRKLEVTKSLRAALREAVEAVKPIRERIRTLKEWERYEAWNAKRSGSSYRRSLHLALCYMNGTPYRKAEARTRLDSEDLPRRGRCGSWSELTSDVARVLVQFGCVPQGTSEADVQGTIGTWIGHEPAVPRAAAPTRPLKLYVVVREDLPPGVQAVQAAHAMREFAEEHPELEHEWHEKSNTVVMLATSEAQLGQLLAQAKLRGVETSVFREPDLADTVTAICFGTKGYKLPLRKLSLALKEKAA